MKKVTLICCVLPLLLFCSTYVKAQGTADVIEEVGTNGVINWTAQYVEATGVSIVNRDKFKNPQQALLMAQRGAEVVAKANLLEAVAGVKVIRETTVKDLMIESDEIKTRLEGTVKGTRTVGKPKVEGDAVTVTVRMAIYGNNSLADAVIDAPQVKNPPVVADNSDTKTPTSAPPVTSSSNNNGNGGKNNSGASTANGTSSGTQNGTVTPANTDTPKPADINEQGVVFDFGDLKFDPTMFPVIVDENGAVVFDFKKLYEEIKKKGGKMPKFVTVGKKVLDSSVEIVKVLESSNGKIKINTKKYPKLQDVLKKAATVGKFILPIIKFFI